MQKLSKYDYDKLKDLDLAVNSMPNEFNKKQWVAGFYLLLNAQKVDRVYDLISTIDSYDNEPTTYIPEGSGHWQSQAIVYSYLEGDGEKERHEYYLIYTRDGNYYYLECEDILIDADGLRTFNLDAILEFSLPPLAYYDEKLGKYDWDKFNFESK